MTFGRFGDLGGAGMGIVVPNTMSLDGSTSNVNGSTTALAATLTTTKTNDVICVMVLTNAGPIISVSSPTLGAFAKRTNAGPSPNFIELWYKASPAVFNEAITVISTSAGYMTIIAFGVNGAKTSAPFDVNASLPTTGTADPLTISTTAVNTMAIGGFGGTTNQPTAGGGYTQIDNTVNSFMLVEYQLLSAAQTNLSVTVGTGAGTTNRSIADALVQGP